MGLTKIAAPYDKLTEVTAGDIHHIALGATLLGAGGGGDPYISELAARYMLTDTGGSIKLVSPEDLAPDATIVCLAGYGAPLVQLEKLLDWEPLEQALEMLEAEIGCKVDAVVAAEMGGANSLIPVLFAAGKGLPVVDGDGMGRAFPGLHMTSFAFAGVNPTPCVMADEHGNCLKIETHTYEMSETLTRAAAIELGLRCFIACYHMKGDMAATATVPDTLSQAYYLGHCLKSVMHSDDAGHHLVEMINASEIPIDAGLLARGQIVDVWRTIERGFSVGRCNIRENADSSDQVRVDFQNEYLLCQKGEKTLASTPDLICLLDEDTATPITTSDVKYGQRVSVIALSCAALFQTDEALRVVGPEAFGFPGPYVPLKVH